MDNIFLKIHELSKSNSKYTAQELIKYSITGILANPVDRTLWINGKPFGNAFVSTEEGIMPSNAEIFNDFKNNKALADYSHAEGKGVVVNNECEHGQGKWNYSEIGTTIMSVGIGESDSDRKNALEITKDGKMYLLGAGNYNGTNAALPTTVDLASLTREGVGMAVEGTTGSIIFNDYSSNVITDKNYSTIFGKNNKCEIENGFVVGQYSGQNVTNDDGTTSVSNKGYGMTMLGIGLSVPNIVNRVIGDSDRYSHNSKYILNGLTIVGTNNSKFIMTGDNIGVENPQHAPIFIVGNGQLGNTSQGTPPSYSNAMVIDREGNTKISGGFESTSTTAQSTFKGNLAVEGTFSNPGADYAEMFEWKDGNPNEEDRVGYFVSLENGKIKIANGKGHVIGVVSAKPGIIGNNPSNWHSTWETDKWGRIQYDMTTDENGTIQYTPKVNPNYDKSKNYTTRYNRKEWSAIGLLGQLLVRQDGSLSVGDFCKANNNGVATKSYDGYYVIEVIDNEIAKILFK